MGSNSTPRNRGVNVGVRFDLAQFTSELFRICGAEVRFAGPGPCDAQWFSCTTTVAERFSLNHLSEEMYSKFNDGAKTPEKRRKAEVRFEEGETLCSLTNCKFEPLPSGQPPLWLADSDARPAEMPEEDFAVFNRARAIIGRVTGAFPGWDAVLQFADFGPGATTRLKRRDGHRSNKWAGRPHVTPAAASPLKLVFDDMPLLYRRLEGPGCQMALGNKLDWVPKNYKTDRTICIEPDWNMYLQKALGQLLRRRLKRVKQDLDDQGTNRFLAALGSITGELATLDLSMASDTVSYRLVEYLLRPDWFEALVQCRSPVGFYKLDGDRHETMVVFEKFSSMGNGFTFELESLIFYGLLRAVSELSEESDHRLYVYGDDLVVPTGMAELAMTYLRKAGFVVNPDKSYWSGPFRESCGGHYFAGADVTPFYVREPVDKLDRLFLLHNNVYRWFNRHPGICDPDDVNVFLQWIRSHAPREWRRPRLLSEDVGDGAFIGTFDEVTPKPIGRSKKRRGWEGWAAATLQYRSRRDVTHTRVGIDADGEKYRYQFSEKSGPDLASLWALERRKYMPTQLIDMKRQRHKVADFLKTPLKDFDVWCNRSTGTDVPLQEREYYVGTQVLPWNVSSRWW